MKNINLQQFFRDWRSFEAKAEVIFNLRSGKEEGSRRNGFYISFSIPYESIKEGVFLIHWERGNGEKEETLIPLKLLYATEGEIMEYWRKEKRAEKEHRRRVNAEIKAFGEALFGNV